MLFNERKLVRKIHLDISPSQRNQALFEYLQAPTYEDEHQEIREKTLKKRLILPLLVLL